MTNFLIFDLEFDQVGIQFSQLSSNFSHKSSLIPWIIQFVDSWISPISRVHTFFVPEIEWFAPYSNSSVFRSLCHHLLFSVATSRFPFVVVVFVDRWSRRFFVLSFSWAFLFISRIFLMIDVVNCWHVADLRFVVEVFGELMFVGWFAVIKWFFCWNFRWICCWLGFSVDWLLDEF